MAGKKATTEAVPHQVQALTPVVGGTIKSIALDNESFSDGLAVGLVVRCPDGTERIVWVLRDAEGNGAGWADVVRL